MPGIWSLWRVRKWPKRCTQHWKYVRHANDQGGSPILNVCHLNCPPTEMGFGGSCLANVKKDSLLFSCNLFHVALMSLTLLAFYYLFIQLCDCEVTLAMTSVGLLSLTPFFPFTHFLQWIEITCGNPPCVSSSSRSQVICELLIPFGAAWCSLLVLQPFPEKSLGWVSEKGDSRDVRIIVLSFMMTHLDIFKGNHNGRKPWKFQLNCSIFLEKWISRTNLLLESVLLMSAFL